MTDLPTTIRELRQQIADLQLKIATLESKAEIAANEIEALEQEPTFNPSVLRNSTTNYAPCANTSPAATTYLK